MNVLITHERSGVMRRAMLAAGHIAFSCDLEKADDGELPGHLQMDAHKAMRFGQWDVIIMHPVCTYLSVSGLHWNKRRPERAAKTEAAIAEVLALIASAERAARVGWIMENPIGCLSTRYRKPDFIFQPYHFGDNASKATCIWHSRGIARMFIPHEERWAVPRIVEWNGKKVARWSNQTDSGQNRLGPSPERAAIRAETYPGFARYLAEHLSRGK